MDPLLGKDLETNNASTTVIKPVVRQLQKLEYYNGNTGVFYVVRAEELS
jgi:hypothetical protein